MQLYAFNEKNELIFAHQAQKQTNYFCLECQQTVRARGGFHRTTHFYHLSSSQTCRLSGKSMVHLQVQCLLKKILPQEECFLEFRFPEINRIADVAWVSKKLIFEIQCSPITALEVQQRNRDYRTQGYQVIWILHDRCFNQRRLTAAELHLRTSPFYFTDMNAEGSGVIYDQFDLIQYGMRRHTLPSLAINVLEPFLIQPGELKEDKAIPYCIANRLKHWPLYFCDDLLDLYKKMTPEASSLFEQVLGLEQTISPKQKTHWIHYLRHFFYLLIVRPYNLLFQIILERACK